MKKTVAMIPVRMGSTRVPKKNIRMLDGKPLVAWIIEAAKEAGCFDEIYLNSEDDLFKEIADQYGIKFYKRPPQMAADSASNDDFMYDFLQNVQCDTVIQLLATSPFLKPETIRAFVEKMATNNIIDTLISVKNIQIECLYMQSPINFIDTEHTKPSQSLIPIQAYACGIMGWDSNTFKIAYKNNAGAYHGNNFGVSGYFPIGGYETVDIDTEEDFILAEVIAQALKADKKKPEYYQTNDRLKIVGNQVETDVNSILTRDGVKNSVLDLANATRENIPKIIKLMGAPSWSYRLVNTPTGSATLICQNPGEGNREHYHPDISEWWYIVEGVYYFLIDGKQVRADAGDIVFVDKGVKHLITAAGARPAIRLAVSVDGAKHVYTDEKK